MRPIGFLMCLGKALVRRAGDMVGLGWGVELAWQVSLDVWDDWQKERDEDRRRAELQALVDLAAQDFRRQVGEVVREVAGALDAGVQQRLAACLSEMGELLRHSFQQAGDSAHLVPLSDSRDLAALLSAAPRAAGPRITLTQTDGPLKGRTFVFDRPGTTILGREEGCHPPFPQDPPHKTISRHHCLLDLNPPDVRVRDLGSVGGTYVNGQLIGKREKGQDRAEALQMRLPERDLKDGDELRLCKRGTAVFQVRIEAPRLCLSCGVPLAHGVQDALCPACQTRAVRAEPARRCVQCNREVAGEAGTERQGDFICAPCRATLHDHPELAPPALGGYTVLNLLGNGGMGAVWLARKGKSNELAALKVMLPRIAADRHAVKRFLREIDTTRGLLHANVVRLSEAGYQRGTFFIALEYCDAGSVANLIQQRGGVLPTDEAIEITLQALEGLHYAHSFFGPGKGLIHRDLKPANLFLTGAGSARRTKIGDYGLAKAFEDTGLSGLTRTGEAAGTPHYMPRQQARYFKQATPAFDVWAMAASLYKMLTGKTPRDFPKGKDPWLVLFESDPVPARERNPKLPAKLAAVIDHALRETPAIGFASAAGFKEALEDAL